MTDKGICNCFCTHALCSAGVYARLFAWYAGPDGLREFKDWLLSSMPPICIWLRLLMLLLLFVSSFVVALINVCTLQWMTS